MAMLGLNGRIVYSSKDHFLGIYDPWCFVINGLSWFPPLDSCWCEYGKQSGAERITLNQLAEYFLEQ